ncbi:hypothetical protein ACFL20_05705 [Spirochaetota bacterium]
MKIKPNIIICFFTIILLILSGSNTVIFAQDKDDTKTESRDKKSKKKFLDNFEDEDELDEKDVLKSKKDKNRKLEIKKKGKLKGSGYGVYEGTPEYDYFTKFALYLGFGGFIPLEEFGDDYYGGFLFSATFGFYKLCPLGISPEVHLRISNVESRGGSGLSGAEMSIDQFLVGLVYRYSFYLPSKVFSFLNRPITLYVRFADGLTALSTKSDLQPDKIIKYKNSLEVGMGLTYPVYRVVECGIDFNYRLVFDDARDNLHGLSVSLLLGLRI